MRITLQNCYDLQYLTMRLSGYMNTPTEHAFLALKHGTWYLMYHPQEPIMYSIVFKQNLWNPTKCISLLTFTCVCHYHAQTFCRNINKKSLQFLELWQFGNTILPDQPDGGTAGNLPLVKNKRSIITCTVVHVLYNVLQNNLSPRTHHYLIHYLGNSCECWYLAIWPRTLR